MINVSLPLCLTKEWAAGNKRQLLNYKIRLALEANAKRKWAELMDALGSLPMQFSMWNVLKYLVMKP